MCTDVEERSIITKWVNTQQGESLGAGGGGEVPGYHMFRTTELRRWHSHDLPIAGPGKKVNAPSLCIFTSHTLQC
jgi:hypothetical protein